MLPQAEPINDDSAPSSLSRAKISKSKQQKRLDTAKASRKQNRKRRKGEAVENRELQIVDVRQAPRHIQEEAFRKGIIPYLPEQREI